MDTRRLPDEAASHLRNIRGLLSRAMLKDRAAAGRRLEIIFQKKARVREPAGLTRDLAELESRLEASCRERIRRERERPPLRFPGELPITALRREIVRAIKSEPVVIISGETGCGKSTQIPKMCLEAGRGVAGRIACTQPRRIAAITIAHRIAEELGETLGRSVGYKIRFRDRSPREAYIKIMTDGMLLAETQSGPRLYDYDTIIIDEAHERSVNIDFLLGIAKNLLVVRPELRVIITSATLDTEKFSRSFHGAPVIHVGGRLYPVEVEYMPAEAIPRKPGDGDYVDMAVHAAEKIQTRRRGGDILIFMPTEQDILETCDRLEGKKFAGTTVLPLFARLPGAQQGRVYSVKGPKIVVATNVAETSLTIPGIKYVIDTGLARISQYQPGTRINSLPVSPVSRSSADQRMGRCGRVQEGHCIRLYSREDYESRPQFTPPEIQRSNLAEVILRMIDLHLGHPSEFPFVDPPPQKTIKDGYETLLELGAVSGEGREYELTPLGRRMARMPLDPKVSRMLLEAEKEGCLREVAVIASGLSIRDPRERPPADTARADARHAVFKHPSSDFLTLLNIWDRFHGPEEMSATRSRQRKFCEENYLSFSRMREWQFIHDQIVSILEEQKVVPGRGDGVEISAELYGAVHRSILSGFLSNIAVHKEKNIYSAAKSREVHVFPGSSLFNQARPWIVSAEVVQTSRLFARIAARIDPAWLEDLGGELCRSSCSEPRWDKEHREVRAKQRVTLFGLEIIKDRDVPFGPVNPGLAHEIFIRSGLLEGDVDHPPPFLRHNLGLVQKISG
ncbi:MAG: ATP-dependent RNA helicase HrpA, partial [Acidobacteriota bacterium]|nr:ATP-dependent RNA helicase HrpA [Acidobacteriota bacterium]